MVKLQFPFLVMHIGVLKDVVLNTQYISLLLPKSFAQVHTTNTLLSNTPRLAVTSVIALHVERPPFQMVELLGLNIRPLERPRQIKNETRVSLGHSRLVSHRGSLYVTRPVHPPDSYEHRRCHPGLGTFQTSCNLTQCQ